MSITLIIIIITGLISYSAFKDQNLRNKLIFHPQSVHQNGEYYRFITHGFIHADFMHLGLNMYVLYVFGEQIEITFEAAFGSPMGRFYYLALYIGAIIFGGLPSFFKHQNNGYYSALGASGGTSGVLLAFCLFAPWAMLGIFFVIPCPAVIAAVLYLAYSSWASKNSNDNIGHDAHFYGGVFGLLFAITLVALLRNDLLPLLWQQLIAGPSF